MAVANHEGSKIDFVNATVGVNIYDIAYQSASITSRVNTQPISAIGYRGIAAITDLIGSVEASLEGIICYSPNDGIYTPGAKGLLNKDLYDYVSSFGDITVETRGEDDLDKGQKATLSAMYLTGLSFNFAQNASATSTWGFVGYNCTWEDSVLTFPEQVGNPADADVHVGDGNNFVPLSSKDLDLVIVVHGDMTGTAAGIQSVAFSSTVNRTEIYQLGQKEPMERPVTFPFEVTANIEALADTATLLRNVTPTYEWNNGLSQDPNYFDIYVNYKLTSQRICGATRMRPVDGSMSLSVGANSTCAMSFTGWNLEF